MRRTVAPFASLVLCSLYVTAGHTQEAPEREIPRLQNPMTVEYLKSHIRQSLPRLVLSSENEELLRQKIETDPVVRSVYAAIRLNAADIQTEPLLERVMEGRRLLAVSREMLYRMNMLGMVYRIEESTDVLRRINDELIAVCRFSDWNPSHYLDVAEMSMAVALALDWTSGDLPQATIKTAQIALIEKGIQPSYSPAGSASWVTGTNNWNQVCHGGMIAASIAIADRDPELAARTIARALDGIPHALVEYGPDGVYPEGSTYWSYGTSFSVATAAMLESAFGTDFGIADYPAFKESAVFRVLSMAPSGRYYNFADCGDRRSENGDLTLAWFAAKTGDGLFFERDRFLRPAEEMGRLSRLAGAGLVWLAQFQERDHSSLPSAWKGGGANPVVFFIGPENDPHGYYFGGKGGRGSVNHGNLDVGSFVLELNGVRWVVDPGNQAYHELERTGFDLWSRCQECERWTLLTKNNFGHSTLSVNGQIHAVNGEATFVGFQGGERPEATIDLTAAFEGQLKSAQRRFVKDSPASLLIEDRIELSERTETIVWQLMTTAEVQPVEGGAVLRQEDRVLKLDILAPDGLNISVISLDPPPLELDRQIDGLKRIEIRLPAWIFDGDIGQIVVRLSGE